jgi:predicted amidohydrolase
MVLAAVVQLCSTACPVRNLSLAQSVIARAAAAGAKLVWLPEASDFIAPAADVPSLSEPLVSSYFLKGIREAAERARVFVGVGVHETPRPGSDDAADGRCYNTNVLVSPCGEVTGMYRKVRPIDTLAVEHVLTSSLRSTCSTSTSAQVGVRVSSSPELRSLETISGAPTRLVLEWVRPLLLSLPVPTNAH